VEKKPAGHCVAAEASGVNIYEPSAASEQVPTPVLPLLDPEEHTVTEAPLLAVVPLQAVPAGQVKQEVAPASEKVPAGHAVVVVASGQKLPAGQMVQAPGVVRTHPFSHGIFVCLSKHSKPLGQA